MLGQLVQTWLDLRTLRLSGCQHHGICVEAVCVWWSILCVFIFFSFFYFFYTLICRKSYDTNPGETISFLFAGLCSVYHATKICMNDNNVTAPGLCVGLLCAWVFSRTYLSGDSGDGWKCRTLGQCSVGLFKPCLPRPYPLPLLRCFGPVMGPMPSPCSSISYLVLLYELSWPAYYYV